MLAAMQEPPVRIEPPVERLPLTHSELGLIFTFWTFIALLSSVNALTDPRGRGLLPVLPSAPIALAFIESYLWALLTPLIFVLVSRYGIERNNRVARIAFFLGVGVAVAMLVDQVVGYFRFDVLFVPRRPRPPDFGPLVRVRRLWFLNELIVYIAVLATAFARDYFLRYRARREEAMRLQAHAAHLQMQLAGARLDALRTQLNPHFLFNTLHAVSALVERDPRGVRRMIARLSELLRTTLDARDAEVTLAHEIGFLRRYLDIMQIRFQGRLEVETRIARELESALVPNLILQPLVENAIRHGVEKIEGIGRIEIEARREGEQLLLTVRDNGPGLPNANPGTSASEGLGLRNTRARLQELYGAEQTLTLRPIESGGLSVEICLPYHTHDDLKAIGVNTESR
jgi:two-component system, LytTR family, sensor kinase